MNVATTATSIDPAFSSVSVYVYPEGETISYTTRFDVNGGNDDSSIVNAGPGRFYLDILAANAEYTITVDDCTNTSGNNNEQIRKHRQNNRINRRHNIGHGLRQYNPINPFRQYNTNNGIFNEDPEDNNSNNQNNNPSSSTQQPVSGNASDNGSGGVSASSGLGGASAQTGGVTANADNLPPVSRPQGNVVNEIPSQGPLPNTGGAPLFWILPLIGLFVLAGLPMYRLARRARR